jgi:hypothetical protein
MPGVVPGDWSNVPKELAMSSAAKIAGEPWAVVCAELGVSGYESVFVSGMQWYIA